MKALCQVAGVANLNILKCVMQKKNQEVSFAEVSHIVSECAATLVAQCSATPATVAATPPCSATPFQTQISVRHLPAQGGGGATPKFLGGVARHRCYTCKTL